MNGKKAKMLRKKAEIMSKGLPLTVYKNNPRIILGECTRKYYKILKKEYKNKHK